MTSYYEAHVTMEFAGVLDMAKADVEKLGWKFSCIDGDAVLGPGSKIYATRIFKEAIGGARVMDALVSCAEALAPKYKVVRRKIELVIFDDRSTKTSALCEENCAVCQ